MQTLPPKAPKQLTSLTFDTWLNLYHPMVSVRPALACLFFCSGSLSSVLFAAFCLYYELNRRTKLFLMPLKIKTLKLFLLENKTPTAITTTHTLLKNDPQD